MQIFLSSNRWTASGNGIRGAAGRSVPYKTVPARRRRPRYADGAAARSMVAPGEGTAAVRLARAAILAGLAHPDRRDAAAPFRDTDLPAVFAEPRGVFVTIRRHPTNALRGCIGFPSPVYPLRVAIPRAAWAAAVDDPRFPPVAAEEMAGVTLEVSILTVPTVVASEPRAGLPGQVVVGRDGLIVDRSGASGLLLPQVAVEYRVGPGGVPRADLREGRSAPRCVAAGRDDDPEVLGRAVRGGVAGRPSPTRPARSEPVGRPVVRPRLP